jgi:hypothetical protein
MIDDALEDSIGLLEKRNLESIKITREGMRRVLVHMHN